MGLTLSQLFDIYYIVVRDGVPRVPWLFSGGQRRAEDLLGQRMHLHGIPRNHL